MTEQNRSSNDAGRRAGGGSRDPHAARESEKYAAPIASREHIIETLRGEGAPIDLEALGERLELDTDEEATEALRRRVRAMIRDGQLIENRRRGLVPVDAEGLVAGRISAHPDGFGFLVSEERDKDIFLNAKQMRQVLHGDRVVVCITGEDRRGRPEGRIVDVVERANRSLVGRLVIEHGVAIVSPDSKRIHQDLLVEPGHRAGAEHGDMVVAEIVEQPSRRQQPLGRIVEVLGQHLTPGMEVDVALHTHGIPVEWPEAVTEQAASFSTTVGKADTAGRKDVRALPLVTIDGADARDFDDAVWCEPTDAGWRLIVAIADVAHYVVPGSALDEEAVRRGTSVYFPGRVVPMLPEVLSNGLCSLNPDVDRLCMLCEMTLDAKGAVKKARFHNGVLRSHARLTYSKVHEILTEPASPLRDEYRELVPMIENLHALYEVLARARRKRGAIEFESNETRIVFDDERKISEIVPVTRNDAHKLIEECMILANIQAAAFLEEHEMPALYRVHNGPKADRLEDLRAFLALRGLSVGGGDTPSAADYAKLSREIEGRPDRSVIQTVMLRSMQQAVYQPKNEGHFGLALEQYAHFTSPIRRYPDLLVHRAIKHAISREKNASYRYTTADMQALGESCSTYERRAEEASRDVVSWLKCEYMQQHVGSEFPGVVSAVTSFGLFVELTGIHIEGLIHITNLARDFYHFDSAAHALVGERTGQEYHLGDAIVVRVAAVNLDERKIDFAEVAHEASSGHRGKRGAKPTLSVVASRPTAGGAGDAVEGADGDAKGKSRKRRGGKRKRTREKAAAAASGQAEAVGDTANAGQSEAAEDTANVQPTAVASGEQPMNPEHRRQLKRREKQRRRDEKRAARMAEKKAARASQNDGGTMEVRGGEMPAPSSSWASRAQVSSPPATKAASGKGDEAVAEARTGTAADKAAGKASFGGKSTATKSAERPASEARAEERRTGETTSGKKAAKRSAAKASADGGVTGKSTGNEAIDGKARARPVATEKRTKSPGAKKAAAKRSTAKKTAGKKAAVKRSITKKSAGKKAAAERSTAKKTAGKKAAVKRSITKKSAGKKAAAERSAAEESAGKKSAAERSTTKKAAGKKTAATRSVTKKASGKKAAAKRSTTKKTAGKKPAAKRSAAKKSAGKKTAGRVTAKKSARRSGD